MRDFGTLLTCMDGRYQRKAADYLTTSFGVRHVDTITAPGMVKHLAETTERTATILNDIDASMSKHHSNQIGVVAHADCAGNPVPDRTQQQQVAKAVGFLERRYPNADIIGLFIDEHRIVERIRTA